MLLSTFTATKESIPLFLQGLEWHQKLFNFITQQCYHEVYQSYQINII